MPLHLEEKQQFDDTQIHELLKRISRQYEGRLSVYASIRRRLIPAEFFRLAADLLPPGSDVLEVGSGIGMFTLVLAAMRPDIRISGFELEPERVRQAEKARVALNIGNAHFACQDLRSPTFASAFDACVAIDLFHHLPKAASDNLMTTAFSSLRPGAKLICKEISTRPRMKWLFTYLLDLAVAPKDSFSYFDLPSRKEQLRTAGFHNVFGFRMNSLLPYPHIVIIGQKA
ncbi:MAG: class I SAM-dependent methyltransferase [Opitutaceae bacterium]|nr:class I SAM-dependent methyltransferase [Opitutaceae bacterium]